MANQGFYIQGAAGVQNISTNSKISISGQKIEKVSNDTYSASQKNANLVLGYGTAASKTADIVFNAGIAFANGADGDSSILSLNASRIELNSTSTACLLYTSPSPRD